MDQWPNPRVVIVGGGFGGLSAAKGLAGAPFEVTLIDRNNYHLFQPLLYQVATAGLSPADIASPIRGILSGQQNASVILANVSGVDVPAKDVIAEGRRIPFDYLKLSGFLAWLLWSFVHIYFLIGFRNRLAV